MPRAVQLAAQEHVALRRSLPREAFDFMGLMHEPGGGADDDDEEQPQGGKQESDMDVVSSVGSTAGTLAASLGFCIGVAA